MEVWQNIIIIFYALLALGAFLKGYHEVKKRKNPFGLAGLWSVLGIFVWGDAVVLGLFWLVVSAVVLFLQDWILFLLIISLFWVVRSGGEVIYWLNEQFAVHHRNAPETLMFYKFFGNESIWFVYQLYWQCFMVGAIVVSIYICNLWIAAKF